MTYDEIANEGKYDQATEKEIMAYKIIDLIKSYGGFDNAWDYTDYQEEIFTNIVELL